jgi:SAM-dependent methyltransferase
MMLPKLHDSARDAFLARLLRSAPGRSSRCRGGFRRELEYRISAAPRRGRRRGGRISCGVAVISPGNRDGFCAPAQPDRYVSAYCSHQQLIAAAILPTVNGRAIAEMTIKYDFDRAELLQFLPESSHVLLDIGCGSGAFGRLLRSRRPEMELWAVEPDLASANAARAGFDHVVVGEFPDDRLPHGKFDVIVCADVLEHMARPERALRAALNAVTADGLMVASIPNVRHWRTVVWPLLRHGTWTYSDFGILDRTHLRFFTRRSACDFFASNGWLVESVTGINMIRRERLVSRLTARILDEFLVPQHVIVARPLPARRPALAALRSGRR